MAHNATNSNCVPYEKMEKAIVKIAFDGMRKTTKREVEARDLYHEINAIDDSVLAHRA